MADVSRSKAELLTLFPNNVIGSITPQELRDLVVSMFGEYAEIIIQEGSVAQSVTGTPQKMTGWLKDGLSVGLVPDYTSGDLTVEVDGVYWVDLNINFSGSANDVFFCAIYVNGSDALLARVDRKLGSGGDVGSACAGGNLNLSATDTIEIYVWSDSGGTSFLPHQASLRARRIG